MKAVAPARLALLAFLMAVGHQSAYSAEPAAPPSFTPFEVNAAHLSGATPIPHQLFLMGVAQIEPPSWPSYTGPGRIAFAARTATSDGGKFQITFPGLAKPVRLVCETTRPSKFIVIASAGGAGLPQDFDTTLSNGRHFLTVDTPDIVPGGNSSVVFWIKDIHPRGYAWEISSCTVSPRP